MLFSGTDPFEAAAKVAVQVVKETLVGGTNLSLSSVSKERVKHYPIP
jgi:hypothetical protein